MNGSNIPLQAGSYGIQGVPSPFNQPGARGYGSPGWTDEHGDFWLFGGYGYDAIGAYGNLNVLWKYDVSTGEWTWMSGSSFVNAAGVYGTQTIPDPANYPRSRCESSASWLDSQNNLWFFGGNYLYAGGYYDLNDLWRFNRSTNEWTWMKGSSGFNQTGIYGTLGVPDSNNTPSAMNPGTNSLQLPAYADPG